MTSSSGDLDYDVFNRIAKIAVREGSAGEARLLAILERASVEDRPMVVAALGDSTGTASIASLRAIALDTSADVDMRTAAIVALVKRDGMKSSDVLSACLRADEGGVRDYAMLGMAVSGDGRDREYVLDRLKRYLRRGKPFAGDRRFLSLQSRLTPMAIYLAIHSDDSGRREIADLIRANVERLGPAEVEWLSVFWPDCVTADSKGVHPEPAQMIEWQKSPLFDPVY